MSGEPRNVERREPLFDRAADLVVGAGRCGTAMLQRRLGIGYFQAQRLVDELMAAGVVGEYETGAYREVKVTRAEWEAGKNG